MIALQTRGQKAQVLGGRKKLTQRVSVLGQKDILVTGFGIPALLIPAILKILGNMILL
jgi:hypothetical protein